MKNLILSLFFFLTSFTYFSQDSLVAYVYDINKNNLYKINNKGKLKKSKKSYYFCLSFYDSTFSSSSPKLQETYLGLIKNYKKDNDTMYMELQSTVDGHNMDVKLVISNEFMSIKGFIENKSVDFYAKNFERRFIISKLK